MQTEQPSQGTQVPALQELNVFSSLEPLKKKKNRTFVNASNFYGFPINSGYRGRRGKNAEVEHNAMVSLIDMARYCYETTSERWHYTTAILKVLPKGMNELNAELACSGNHIFNELKKRVENGEKSTKNQEKRTRTKLLMMWALEFSKDFGFHYHTLFIINKHEVTGSRCIKENFYKMKAEKPEWSEMELEIVRPDKNRVNNPDLKAYFNDHEQIMVPMGGNCMLLDAKRGTKDYEYMISHVSYFFKRNTKENVLKIGKRTFGGTQIKNLKPANDSIINKVA